MPKTPEDRRPASAAVKGKSLTAQDVLEYLQDHPDFLLRHPELLELQMAPKRQWGDPIIDFQYHMVNRLRHDVARLRADQDDILANTRDNLTTLDRIHKACLQLLSAPDFRSFVGIVSAELPMLLDVDIVTLALATATDGDYGDLEGVIQLSPHAIDSLIGESIEVALRDDVSGEEILFREAASLVRSDAMLRLRYGEDRKIGLIAFGTRHPGYFHAGQGTELLSFLARILEHCLGFWLDRTG